MDIPDYYDFKSPGIGRNVIFSCCTGIILISILLLIEYRVFEKIRYKIWKSRLPSSSLPETSEDSDVLNEKQKIKNLTPEQINNSSLVMRDVTKYYKRFRAVNNLCLEVNKYECFGLLGVNGAGKTTTFKMLTGDVKISSGDAWINGLSLKSNMKDIYQLIGYCPQFDALLNELTCKETIIIFGLLRGMTLKESRFEAERLSHEFDFRQHLYKKVKELSGGNKRKLSTSIALIGDPLVVYLDEPTTGMDPATKRYLWNALCKIRDSGKCIILTSHSMEECEALCTRLAIMVNGTFMCLGSTQHLKSKFSEGYTLIVKVRKNENSEELDENELQPIEEFVRTNFNDAIVREKHQELITFYIPNKNQSWSKMFGIMEASKTSLNIEDYSLGQSSLEQV